MHQLMFVTNKDPNIKDMIDPFAQGHNLATEIEFNQNDTELDREIQKGLRDYEQKLDEYTL